MKLNSAILPIQLKALFEGLVNTGAINIAHPIKPSQNWAVPYWGEPNACESSVPIVFFGDMDGRENRFNLGTDQVQISFFIGFKVRKDLMIGNEAVLDEMWWKITRMFGINWRSWSFPGPISLPVSGGGVESISDFQLPFLGISETSLSGSINGVIEEDGQEIYRKMARLTLTVYFEQITNLTH